MLVYQRVASLQEDSEDEAEVPLQGARNTLEHLGCQKRGRLSLGEAFGQA